MENKFVIILKDGAKHFEEVKALSSGQKVNLE